MSILTSRATDRPRLRGTAPALDPTAVIDPPQADFEFDVLFAPYALNAIIVELQLLRTGTGRPASSQSDRAPR